MRTIIKYTRFFIFTENYAKSFLAEFNDGINIIYGANTSGKSTIIQAINYTFGVNDEKYKLSEILSEKPIFRIDFTLYKNQQTEKCTIIRDTEFMYIKVNETPIVKFAGISENNSTEHFRLKEYLSNLFGFGMTLNSKGNEVNAPIEAMILPYYVAQDYGWILPLKSFKNFEFYKSFKESYYDYYLGISSNLEEKTEKYKLEEEKKVLNAEIEILEQIRNSRKELVLAKINDEAFIKETIDYVEEYNKYRHSLIYNERKYIIIANELKYNEERLSVLRDTKKHLEQNDVSQKKCPYCNQLVINSLAEKYIYFQNCEDTSVLIETIKGEIKKLTSKLNSIKRKIEEIRNKLENYYTNWSAYKINNLSVNDWVKNKANVQLLETIQDKETSLKDKLTIVNNNLKRFKTEENIKAERKSKSKLFEKKFQDYLQKLNVKRMEGDNSPYKISVFPQQGVELLKTVLAYHFAFNCIIEETDNIHKFPLCLDAIFKEDVDVANKESIISFIYNNLLDNSQLICSIAESTHMETDREISVNEYNNKYLNNSATLIKTGDVARSLLQKLDDKHRDILTNSISLMNE